MPGWFLVFHFYTSEKGRYGGFQEEGQKTLASNILNKTIRFFKKSGQCLELLPVFLIISLFTLPLLPPAPFYKVRDIIFIGNRAVPTSGVSCIHHRQVLNALFYAEDPLMRCTEEKAAGQPPRRKGHTPGNASGPGH